MKNIILSLFSIFLALFLGEMVLRLVPVEDPYKVQKYPPVLNGFIRSQFPPGMELSFSTEEGLPGFENEGVTSFTVNSTGFRGDELEKGAYRIFAVGGSTTECLYLDDNEHWPHLLQDSLRLFGMDVNVQNAGKSGDAIDDHIAMISHRIIHLDPDMIIIYMGVNDVLRLICNRNVLKYDEPGEKLPVFRHFLSEFQLYRRLHNILSKNRNRSKIALESDYRIKANYARRLPVTDTLPKVDYDYFKKKVDLLINICKTSSGARTVFIPQLTTWDTHDEELEKWHWMTEICGSRYDRHLLAGVMDRVNEIIAASCKEHDVPVIEVDLAPTTEYFYDDCHLNPAGSKIFAAQVLDSLKMLLTKETYISSK